ncbi:phosphopantetheine-binding protein [Nocardia sp. CNY236]|uniref:phosphopantetheine-binding protein n=1 Tax=Nocardia sp. CNY236 TaxID=1169152 RepID=UPI00048DE73A|nr:phosphopantetheine-binding protein [Nocardia sp. CNY236]
MRLSRERVIADIADVLHTEPTELHTDTDLTDLGLDSIRLTTLVDRWRASGAQVGFAELADKPVVGVWLLTLTDAAR